MTACIHMWMLMQEHCWSISDGSCLTTLLKTPILLWRNAYLEIRLGSQYASGRSNQDLMDAVKTWQSSQLASRLLWHEHAEAYFPIWQISQFWCCRHSEVARVQIKYFLILWMFDEIPTASVVSWSEFLVADREVLGLISGTTRFSE
jgi:hypothetical protein